MKFSNLTLGKRAERIVTIPLMNGEEKQELRVALVPLNAQEERDALAFAKEFARTKSEERPSESESLHMLGLMVKTVELGCLDPDDAARKPYFDGGTEQILKHLGRGELTHIWQRHQRWQEECSPAMQNMSFDKLLDKVIEIAEAETDLPFSLLSPGLQWSLVRFMATLLLRSPEDKLQPGSSSETSPKIS